MFFWENGDEDLVLSSFSNCNQKYLGPTYFTVYINFLKFSLKQEKPNDTLLPLYIFLNAMNLNLKAKGHFDIRNWLFPCIVLLQYKKIFKILARLFLLFMCRKKRTTQFFIWKVINTIYQWEIWWEVDECPSSCKLWQKPQLFLLQATYWKKWTSQLSLG